MVLSGNRKLKKLRVLVAGGCHVVGYPIGEKHSFVNVTKQILALGGICCEMDAMGRTPVTRRDQLVERLKAQRPDILVLQLGNYETNITFQKYFRKRLGLTKI